MIRFFDLKIIGSDSKDVKYWSMKWQDDIAGFRFRKISLASERPKIVTSIYLIWVTPNILLRHPY